ncbi:zincin-like metallopeptidase domain-containing protein [Flavobacterium cucumis]|uniref:Antirestriction protein ArdC n=1 Tax=Flavobacterium cucumis TaxID=416016 RepID=A0A1M7ZVI4_9FLAO|nr:zincin-like metallopeptidase domain-containing protein [Flavobacterium cucumis]SHO72891.1 Antirestriction protein ArdC [Flavobacterium cucumis]
MSKAVEKFNGLNGMVATREELQQISIMAENEEQFHVKKRVDNVLNDVDCDEWEIEIKENAFEVVPKSILNGIDFDSLNEIENNGLNKAVSPNEIYDTITKMIIEGLEKPLDNWDKTWNDDQDGYLFAYNYETKKPYRSINQIILNPHLFDNTQPTLKNPYFLTFKQIEANKGKLKKGSKGKMVTYYSFKYSCIVEELGLDFVTYDLQKFIDFVVKNNVIERLKLNLSVQEFANQNSVAFIKYYNVFNGADIEGIDFDLDNFKLAGKMVKIVNHHEKIPTCEAIIEAYPNPKPEFVFKGNQPAYFPKLDKIEMTPLEQFKFVQAYYTVFFHEIIHSTGHSKRLNRENDTRKRDGSFEDKKAYRFEELVAEIGAMLLCSHAGILHYTVRNSLTYIKGYRDALIKMMKEDNKFIFKASTLSQKAVDYLLENVDFSNIEPVSKVQKKTKKPVQKPNKETKKVVKPSEEPVSKVQKKTKTKPMRYAINDLVKWEGEMVKISKVVKIGNDVKFELNLGKNKTIWTDENTLDSEAKKPIKAQKKEIQKPIEQPVKVDSKGQTSLFGVKKVTPKSAPKKHAKISKIALAGNDQESEFYTVAGEVGKFLQQVERKPVESVVITMDGQQGAGKTTTLYKFMNSFAITGNKCLFLSLEEHPASSLAKDKVSKYLSIEAQENIDTVGEVENIVELYDFIKDYEIIFIDSWQKLQRMVGAIRLDEDLRKKFNGKVFVVIFQQTTTGRTKGGAEVVFDGDIIIKMVKESSFSENYAYFDKNRYTLIAIEDIRYNIASGTTYNPNAKEEPKTPATELQPVEEVEFSFVIK